MNHRKDFKDINFVAIATVHSHHVDYVIYDIEGIEFDDTVLFHKKGAMSYPTPVTNIEDAEPYLHGYVKWDGCSNWHFDEQDRSMMHACNREGVHRFGEVMARCWDWTAELCPSWDA